MTVARAHRYPQPRPSPEVLAEMHADPCVHGGLPDRCPMCRATSPVPAGPAPRPRRRRKPKPPPAPPVQIQLPLPGQDDDEPASRREL